jgi:polysaccharide biosynthesis/export protein
MIKRSALAFVICLGMLGVTSRSLHAQTQTRDSADSDVLRPGDVIKLWIWREEDMTGEFAVPESGVVVFPKIGPVKVTGRNTVELKNALVREYQRYLSNPSIEVTFLYRVNILGAVNKPGVYPVDRTMTIANALALAEGPRAGGKSDEVQLIRGNEKLVTKISQRTRVSELPIQSGDQLYVPEQSWAERNSGILASMLLGLVSVAVTIIVNN